ncbi:MAG TPA: TauD/TfdA family dioxygenase, partial [Thermoanaerobaculia bacterium]|nr:TauD/TfdA family dioxygenase [Thermoanaerobaculia bacterium]
LFRDKGVQYLRNYGTGLGLGWQRVFRSDSRDEVEIACRQDLFDFEWLEGDRLRTRCTRPAVIQHPRTGEWSWFAQIPHWHPAFLDAATRASLEEIFQKPEDMPRNCFFGDGTAIGDDIAAEIMDAYESSEVAFPWERGDVLLVDNILTAHARNPFVGERKLLIAMGEMTRFE